MAIPEPYRARTFDQALSHLIEELGELVSAAGKTGRFGLDAVNPELPPVEQETNFAWMQREFEDVLDAWLQLRDLIRQDGSSQYARCHDMEQIIMTTADLIRAEREQFMYP